MKISLKQATLGAIFVMFTSLVFAKPAPTHYVNVVISNTCSRAINVHIDNNWGSAYMGSHTIPQKGIKDPNGQTINGYSYIFSSSNDEEFYTVSYQNAQCKIDYPLIRDRWELAVIISDCNTTPKCSLK